MDSKKISCSKTAGTYQIRCQGTAGKVPSTVHTDLFGHKLIEDPFYADNEIKLKWIEDQEWIYENEFNFPKNFNGNRRINLIFEGLDTIAEIILNGQRVGFSANMFRVCEYDVTDLLKSKKNILRIIFHPPRIYAKKIQQKINQFPSARHVERVFVRKAQYSFGWDWGPAFPTSGIWRPVYLIQKEKTWINTVRFNTLSLTTGEANVQTIIQIQGKSDRCRLKATLAHGRDIYNAERPTNKEDSIEIKWKIPDPFLWWPNGMGEANLWDLIVDLIGENGEILDHQEKKVGIRKIDLLLKENGNPTFRFLVNSRPVYIKGANWIPADSFLPRVEGKHYAALLNQAFEADMNMIRVWGGGIYENEIFYDLCDKLGLMVWQDFMFACAAYPEHKDFVNEVKEEVKQNILRLQTHPCIAIWCGNNENEWIWYRDNCGKINEMPGYSIFHQTIPALLKDLDPHRPYWPTTPFGQEDDPNDYKSGNRHVWDIWSQWNDYTQVLTDHSHFVTEFGFQGPANYDTLTKVIPEKDMRPHSFLIEFHNKQDEGPERLTRFLAAHLPLTSDMKSYVYLTQLNQGLALKTCLDHWRQNWPKTSGTIIWQLNDCWPVSSWSLIDSALRPKAAYYFVKRAFTPLSLIFHASDGEVFLKISKHLQQNFQGLINLYQFSVTDGYKVDSFEISIHMSSSDHIFQVELPAGISLSDKGTIFIARLSDNTGKEICRECYHSRQWKHTKLPKAAITKKMIINSQGASITLSSPRLALYVTLSHPDLVFTDNALILLPNEKFLVGITRGNLSQQKMAEINISCLNQFMRNDKLK